MAEWVIAGEGKNETGPVVGRSYEVRHSRKGTFDVKVMEVIGEWAYVEILRGTAKAVMAHNVAGKGETIRVRDSLTYWIPLQVAP